MLIHECYVDLAVDGDEGNQMRVHVFHPQSAVDCKLGAVAVFTEIYQVTGPIQRLCRIFASEGFLVASPESYHEYEEAGEALPYDTEGTDRGNDLKTTKPVTGFDADARTVVSYLKSHSLSNGRVGAMGMCLGGHLAFRAGFLPDVLSIACLFATDIHTSSLGTGDDSISRVSDLGETEVLMIWGRQDNHIPIEGRRMIKAALDTADVDYSWCEFNAQHAFIRDELSKGRYDPSLASICRTLILEQFRRRLTLGLPSQRNQQPQATASGPQHC